MSSLQGWIGYPKKIWNFGELVCPSGNQEMIVRWCDMMRGCLIPKHNEITGSFLIATQYCDMQKEILINWWKNWFYWEAFVQKNRLVLTKYSTFFYCLQNIPPFIIAVEYFPKDLHYNLWVYVRTCQFNLDRLPCSSHAIMTETNAYCHLLQTLTT